MKIILLLAAVSILLVGLEGCESTNNGNAPYNGTWPTPSDSPPPASSGNAPGHGS